jgi:glycosyltransferase involved in cell wall biosynthesis
VSQGRPTIRAAQSGQSGQPGLNILHCLRAPVGGLFRHVTDLATAQAALGHRVGVVCAAGGDTLTEARLLAFAPSLRLGLHRLPMGRDLGFSDVMAWRQVVALARDFETNVLHGHGAKGGAYARLAARQLKSSNLDVRCFYTPHGGSLHYPPTTLPGKFYGALERQLERYTDGLLFESRFAAERYAQQIGVPACPSKVVTNGLLAREFEPVAPNSDAADFVFVGELRRLKGVDVALEALADVRTSQPATAVFVGDGPDAESFKAQAQALGLGDCTSFPGAMRARDAFALGRVLLMPSRAESLPYIVLEAIGASLPVIATNVGGIPEIIPPECGPLLPAADVGALANAMRRALSHPETVRNTASILKTFVQGRFTVAEMTAAVTDFYTTPERARRAA